MNNRQTQSQTDRVRHIEREMFSKLRANDPSSERMKDKAVGRTGPYDYYADVEK